MSNCNCHWNVRTVFGATPTTGNTKRGALRRWFAANESIRQTLPAGDRVGFDRFAVKLAPRAVFTRCTECVAGGA